MSSNVSVQVIDEDKAFQRDNVEKYLKSVVTKDLGVDYHVISVFGSQSTGKSTLLNKLFHTQFDVMNETQRQQTTKGIWLGYSPKIETTEKVLTSDNQEQVFVMDVEGSDGRERGEDQDFERKAALFALSTSEVLIVNIWEHQVGLYQGANMGLLKTVFEVNLSLFGNKDHKVLLLFVIRDHVGATPLSNLSKTLTDDLNKMWSSISKPSTVREDVQLSDYFDIEFTGLAHKVLQPDKFEEDVKSLGDRFANRSSSDHLFKKDYKQNFPIDGWTLYAENCWDQIQSNKDLDLPTQQILVARFRCDEIVKECMESFNSKFTEMFGGANLSLTTGVAIAKDFKELRDSAFTSYDAQASHYNKEVYASKRETLRQGVNSKLSALYNDYIKDFKKATLLIFTNTFTDKSNKMSFQDKSISAKELALENFVKQTEPFTALDNEAFDHTQELEEFGKLLEEELANARRHEIQSLVNRTVKKVSPLSKNQTLEFFGMPEDDMWDKILENFRGLVNNALAKFKTEDGAFDFKLGSLSEAENAVIADQIGKACWINFDHFIHEYLSEDNVVNILRRQFEDVFTYDSNNVPRVWKNETDIAGAYKEATEYALKSLPLFALAKLSNDSEILPDYNIYEDEDSDDEEDTGPHRFAHILTSTQQNKIRKEFLKQAEIAHRDANRSIVSKISQVPPLMYVLLLVLGWNEFMAILRNPLYLVLTIMIGTCLFFVHTLNLWGPLELASNTLIKEGKDWLASVLLEEHQKGGRTPILASPVNTNAEEYGMEDLSEKAAFEEK
ncbi:Protein SEY1 [Cyberlindnera fabianii]|uniref:Protein SEY1 n=1 Tax=Cyberlindnera fabianii TaxID=36022 RepID=A0A1V2L7J0_CYBFA|nr:Protein SEY1 [Cyberlindnera fabianii]